MSAAQPAPSVQADAPSEVEQLRLRLERSEAARNKLRQAASAGLAANAELQKELETLRTALNGQSAKRVKAEVERTAALKRLAEAESQASAAAAALASERSRAADAARRIAALEAAASEATTLRTRVSALERSLAIVREVANGDAAPQLRSPPANTTAVAGGLQSALSGFQHAQPAAAGAEPEALGAAPTDARLGNEMVVDSGGRGRKRGRPPATAAARPAAVARDSSPEPQAPRPPLPPPLSPLVPRRAAAMEPLPPPLSPLRPPPAAAAPVALLAERKPATAAPKRPMPVAKAKKVGAAEPTAPPPAERQPGRPGALPLGKGRSKAAPPPAAPAQAPVAEAEPLPELTPAEAAAEAAGASVTGEVGVRGVLHDAARDGPASAAAAARGIAAATLTRNVSPTALLAGITSALRAESACANPALIAAVLALDAELARARQQGRGGAVRMLGGGAAGGFADAVCASLHSSALEAATSRGGGASPGPAAHATVALMRARDLQTSARVFLLDLLLLGSGARAATRTLAVAVQSALRAWPGLLSGADPLAVSASVVVLHLLRDADADSWPPLEPHLAGATLADAKQLALEWLFRCSTGEADNDALHSAVRGLELLANHCGWTWSYENIIEPHLCDAFADERSDKAALAAQALGPLLLVGLRDDAHSPSLDAARVLLKTALQARHGSLSAGSCAVARGALEVDCRGGDAGGKEFVAVSGWWRSLSPLQRSRLPERLQSALRSAGLLAAMVT